MRRLLVLFAALAASLGVLGPAQGAFPGANGLIAYNCNSGICGVNPDGSAGGKVLVPSGFDPAWSPNGAKLAYTQGSTIYTASADGSNAVPVDPGAQPTWSSDNATIVYINPAGHLALKGSSGERELTTTAANDPAVSPNGQTVVYSADLNGDLQLYSIPLSGGSPTKLTIDVGDDHVAPSWSPNGATIVFENDSGLATIPAAGNVAQHQIVTANAHTPKYSPDGAKIVYESGFGLVVADASGANPQTILSSFSNASLPDWGSAALSSSGPPPPSDTVGGPTNTSYPTITLATNDSAPTVGHSMFATTGTWSGTFPITYTYQWKRCDAADPVNGSCFNISGATSSSYTPTFNDFQFRIRVAVSATNPDGRHTQNSEVTQPTTAIAPKNTVTPPVSPANTNVVDTPLSVATGTWTGSTPIAFTYSWRRCDPVGDFASCVPITGATSSTYTPTVADIGFSLRVWVTGANPLGSDVSITNHTFPIVDKQHFAPTASTAPAIGGTVVLGRQLTANIGTFQGDAPIATTFGWYRCDATGEACHAIAGTAAKLVYHPTAADVGFTLRLLVFASNDYGKLTAESDPTTAIAGTPPHVRGRRIVGTSRADYLAGGGHDDVILGLAGNDTILGGAGDDRIYGGAGNDVITGGGGADTISGGAGSDTIDSADGERDVVSCGDGRDRVTADSYDVVGKDCEVVTIAPTP